MNKSAAELYADQRLIDMWPDLARGKIVLAPVRVGMNRQTGEMMVGWPHVRQSIWTIFMTRFHERVLRRWVGSFVPHILGELANEQVITRFFWAIASAIELWEPNYRITRIRVQTRKDGSLLTSAEELRTGHLTHQTEGVYRPRAHLGDATPENRKIAGWIRRGSMWWGAA